MGGDFDKAACDDGEVGVFMVATIMSMVDLEMSGVSPCCSDESYMDGVWV